MPERAFAAKWFTAKVIVDRDDPQAHKAHNEVCLLASQILTCENVSFETSKLTREIYPPLISPRRKSEKPAPHLGSR